MGVIGFDHIAMPAARVEELIAFYKRLGFPILGEERWRTGEAPMFAIQVGGNKINVHPPAHWSNPEFTLRAPAAQPGSGDFCVIWAGTVADVNALLDAAGAPVEVGPVPRVGGRGGGTVAGTSLYTRDPDGNLLEFIVYDEA